MKDKRERGLDALHSMKDYKLKCEDLGPNPTVLGMLRRVKNQRAFEYQSLGCIVCYLYIHFCLAYIESMAIIWRCFCERRNYM